MHALVIAIALFSSDSEYVAPVLDADTLSIVGTLTDTDSSWWNGMQPSLSITPSFWNQLRIRAQIRPLNCPLGVLVNIDTIGATLSGIWAQCSLPGVTMYAGDVLGSFGSGLLFGSARGGMRSSRTIQPPATTLPVLRPCRSTLRDPAIRGIGGITSLDSLGSSLGVLSGVSLLDSSYTTIMMGSIVQGACTIGAGIVHNATNATLGGSAWLYERTERSSFLAELAFSSSILPSMQCFYRYGTHLFSVTATAWCVEPESNLKHGALLLRSSTDNSWGYAFSIAQTLPKLVGWNILFQSYGTLTRSYFLPFPSRNYSLRAEVRQTITSLFHATWRLQLARLDEGATLMGVRGQAQTHSFGLQGTVERTVHPRLRWQARADARWQWTTNGDYQSSAASVTAYWEPLSTVDLHVRAIVYASPVYDLSTWIMEYTSADLQRLLVCNGYGAQMHVSGSAAITDGLRFSALGVLRYDATTSATTATGYLSVGYTMKAP